MERRQKKMLGFNIDLFSIDEALEYSKFLIENSKGSHIVTINPEMIQYAKGHAEFAKILHEAELVIPDGTGIKLGLLVNGINVHRIAGIEFAKKLMQISADMSLPVALVGAKQEILEKAKQNLQSEMPDLNIVYAHNGYFTNNEEIYNELTQKKPSILFVATGSPKQEEFIYGLKDILPSTLMIGIGGSFDVWSGVVKRAPKIWQRTGLEWLYRTITQPERFKRIFPTLPIFVYNVIIERLIKKEV